MVKTRTPLVGIVIPCFNQGKFAEECIASLWVQTYSNWTAILLDDASTDGVSAELCRRLESDRVAVVHILKNLGRALIRNEGVRRLGFVDFVLSVDCDDRLSPSYIEQLVDAMEATPMAGLAYGSLHFFNDGRPEAQPQVWPARAYDRATTYLENVIPGPGTMVRAAALGLTQLWRSDFTEFSGEDFDFWLQIVEGGWSPVWVHDATYHYRQHATSFLATANSRRTVEVDLNILKWHADGIAALGQTEAFLSKTILPTFLFSIRHGDFAYAARILVRALPSSGLCLVRLVAHHYMRRFVFRVRARE